MWDKLGGEELFADNATLITTAPLYLESTYLILLLSFSSRFPTTHIPHH